MKKNFTVILPDEPYKTATVSNTAVQCTYQGPRYLVARIHAETRTVQNVVWQVEELDQINMDAFVEEGHEFFIIDAVSHPFQAAVASNSYTHGEIENYEETLPTGETWTHTYESGTGILDHIYMPFTMTYDLAVQTFADPVRRTHFLSRDSFFEGLQNQPSQIAAALEINDYTDEERTTLENYKTWLENLSTTYANVDHWKIPFPTNLPPF